METDKLLKKRKIFVKSGIEEKDEDEKKDTKKDINREELGKEVQEFYKQIISAPPTKKKRRTRKVESDSSSNFEADSKKKTNTSTPQPKEEEAPRYYCESCKEVLPAAISVENHIRSVVHLISDQDKPSKVYYIREDNKGYQMLKSMDWNEEIGLGAFGQGQLDPVKTQLKTDKKGLGLEKYPFRITHFKPGEIPKLKQPKSQQQQVKHLTKAQRNLQYKRQQQKAQILHRIVYN